MIDREYTLHKYTASSDFEMQFAKLKENIQYYIASLQDGKHPARKNGTIKEPADVLYAIKKEICEAMNTYISNTAAYKYVSIQLEEISKTKGYKLVVKTARPCVGKLKEVRGCLQRQLDALSDFVTDHLIIGDTLKGKINEDEQKALRENVRSCFNGLALFCAAATVTAAMPAIPLATPVLGFVTGILKQQALFGVMTFVAVTVPKAAGDFKGKETPGALFSEYLSAVASINAVEKCVNGVDKAINGCKQFAKSDSKLNYTYAAAAGCMAEAKQAVLCVKDGLNSKIKEMRTNFDSKKDKQSSNAGVQKAAKEFVQGMGSYAKEAASSLGQMISSVLPSRGKGA